MYRTDNVKPSFKPKQLIFNAAHEKAAETTILSNVSINVNGFFWQKTNDRQ